MKKFRHYFKTRKEFDKICPNPFDINDLYFCESYIEDTEEIYTHGKFYCESLTENDIDLICSEFYIPIGGSTSTAESTSSVEDISEIAESTTKDINIIGIGDWDEEANISS